MVSSEEKAKSSLIEDFVQLKKEKSLASRERLVQRICEQYGEHAFKDQEKQIVHEIITILASDVERTVRSILSEGLKENTEIPHDVAKKLASDIESDVALPMLQFSKILTDIDLEMIIKSTSEVAKLEAIASRENLSVTISDQLVDKEEEKVTKTLLENSTANISESSLVKVMEQFGGSDGVMNTLINRGGLSVGLAERMISMVSEGLQKQIADKYDLKPSVAQATIESAREEVTLDVVSRNVRPENTSDLVNHLYSSGKLTHSIVLRALCSADLRFFEAGMAKLAGIPESNAKKLVRQGDQRAFSALFHAASMPPTMLEATEALLGIIREDCEKLESGGAENSNHLIERIVHSGYDKDVPNMNYFMALITKASEQGSMLN